MRIGYYRQKYPHTSAYLGFVRSCFKNLKIEDLKTKLAIQLIADLPEEDILDAAMGADDSVNIKWAVLNIIENRDCSKLRGRMAENICSYYENVINGILEAIDQQEQELANHE